MQVLELNPDNKDAVKQRAIMVKSSRDAHSKAGTSPPELVTELWEQLQEVKGQQRELEQQKAEQKRLEREAEREHEYNKTRDHFAVGAQYNTDNDRKVVEHAMKFLAHPGMAQFDDENRLAFLVHKIVI